MLIFWCYIRKFYSWPSSIFLFKALQELMKSNRWILITSLWSTNKKLMWNNRNNCYLVSKILPGVIVFSYLTGNCFYSPFLPNIKFVTLVLLEKVIIAFSHRAIAKVQFFKFKTTSNLRPCLFVKAGLL